MTELLSGNRQRCYGSHMSEAPSEVAQTESPDPQTTREASGSFWFLWSFVLLLLAYPLSLGPVAKLYKGRRPPSAVIAFYEPIDVVYKTSTGRNIVDWYLHFWDKR
jgi:hypothetical protein